MWEVLYYLAASLVMSLLFKPKQNQNNSPASRDDFNFPQADEGTPQAVYFGECWSSAWTVLAVGDYRVEDIVKKGKKK